MPTWAWIVLAVAGVGVIGVLGLYALSGHSGPEDVAARDDADAGSLSEPDESSEPEEEQPGDDLDDLGVDLTGLIEKPETPQEPGDRPEPPQEEPGRPASAATICWFRLAISSISELASVIWKRNRESRSSWMAVSCSRSDLTKAARVSPSCRTMLRLAIS